MAWKFDESGNVVLDENKNPIFVDDVSGNEKGIDYGAVSVEKSNLIKESVGRKSKIQELEKTLSIFGDVEDLAAWRKQADEALVAVGNLNADQAAQKEDFAKRLSSAVEPVAKERDALKELNEQLHSQLSQEKISNSLTRSKFVTEKVAEPALVADLFAKRFKVVDGVVVGHDSNGEVIYHDGKVADFDQALARIIDESPYKKSLLKGSSASGGGASPNAGNGGGGHDKNPFSKEHRNVTEQNKLALENPNLAKQLAKAAGHPFGG